MEEKEDVFRFEDFLKGSKLDDLMKMKQNLLEEGVFDDADDSEGSEEYETIDQDLNPYRIAESVSEEEDKDSEEEDIKMPIPKNE